MSKSEFINELIQIAEEFEKKEKFFKCMKD